MPLSGSDKARRDSTALAKPLSAMAVNRPAKGRPHGDRRPSGRPIRFRESGVHLDNQASGIRTVRSEEHTSELQSLMRISYAVFCLKKKKEYKSRRTQQTTASTTIGKQKT